MQLQRLIGANVAILAFYAFIFCAIWFALVFAPWMLMRFSPGAGKAAALLAVLALGGMWTFALSAGIFESEYISPGMQSALLYCAIAVSLSIMLSSGLYLLRRR